MRLADGVPMAVEKTWIAVRVMPDLLTHGVPASIYGAMAAAGLVPTWGEDAIEAVSGDALVCEHLQIPVGSAVLAINRRTYADDTAISYSRSWYRGDRYKLWVPISGPHRTLYPPRGGSR